MSNSIVIGAVRQARTLLDSVAFVSVEGDTVAPIAALDSAIAILENKPPYKPPRDGAGLFHFLQVLNRCDAFISGFEDDDSQTGVRELLADIRALTGK